MSTLLVIFLVWALGIPALVLAMALTLPRLARRRPSRVTTAEVTRIFPAQGRPASVIPIRARGHR